MLRRRVEIFLKFKFLKFRLTGKYFSEIQKDGHFDEKERKKQNNDKYSEKQSHEKTRKTIRPIAERNSQKGGFSGEGIFRGTLPCHKLGEITTLSQEHGSGVTFDQNGQNEIYVDFEFLAVGLPD